MTNWTPELEQWRRAMSHDRGCFRCYEDPPYDGCREANCPKRSRGRYADSHPALTPDAPARRRGKSTTIDMWRSWYATDDED